MDQRMFACVRVCATSSKCKSEGEKQTKIRIKAYVRLFGIRILDDIFINEPIQMNRIRKCCDSFAKSKLSVCVSVISFANFFLLLHLRFLAGALMLLSFVVAVRSLFPLFFFCLESFYECVMHTIAHGKKSFSQNACAVFYLRARESTQNVFHANKLSKCLFKCTAF